MTLAVGPPLTIKKYEISIIERYGDSAFASGNDEYFVVAVGPQTAMFGDRDRVDITRSKHLGGKRRKHLVEQQRMVQEMATKDSRHAASAASASARFRSMRSSISDLKFA